MKTRDTISLFPDGLWVPPQVLVPLYLVMILGWLSGRSGRADTFTLDRLNSFSARVALPGRRSIRIRAVCVYLDRLRSVNEQAGVCSLSLALSTAASSFAGLLYRNIATANLYDADFNVILADFMFKVRVRRGVGERRWNGSCVMMTVRARFTAPPNTSRA